MTQPAEKYDPNVPPILSKTYNKLSETKYIAFLRTNSARAASRDPREKMGHQVDQEDLDLKVKRELKEIPEYKGMRENKVPPIP